MNTNPNRTVQMQEKHPRISGPKLVCILLLVACAGCARSHVIQVTVTNTSTEKITTIEIAYPEATFGINLLDPGKSFRYKIKPTGTGALKIGYYDAHGMEHKLAGPEVHKNDEGSIEIKLTQDKAAVSASIR